VLLTAGSHNAMTGLTCEDVLHSALPTGHGNALMLTMVGAFILGATAVLARRFSASRYEVELVESGATITSLLGSMSHLVLMQPPSGVAVRKLKKAFVVPVAAEIRRDIEARWHCKVYTGYGLADAGMPIWTAGPEFPEGSCGHLLEESWEARLLDEQGKEVGIDEPGELWVRSVQPHLSSQGYWRMPEATAARFRDRWIGTGDLFRRDAAGWFYFLDRAKDTIRRRGENVSAQEVEATILAHPMVADCAVYAVPSEMSEDEVMVSAVLKPGQQLDALELIKSIEKKLPYFAVPRFVRFVAELPRAQTQKVQKAQLKKIAVTPDTWDLEQSNYKVSR
jgi:crotonobetaine/carnitine-CoA ligase